MADGQAQGTPSTILNLFDQRIGDLVSTFVPGGSDLVERAVERQDQLKAAAAAAGANPATVPKLGEILVGEGMVEKETMQGLLAAQAAAKVLKALDNGVDPGARPIPLEQGDPAWLQDAQTLYNQTLDGSAAPEEARVRALEALRHAEAVLREQGLTAAADQIRTLRGGYGDTAPAALPPQAAAQAPPPAQPEAQPHYRQDMPAAAP